MGTNYQFRTKKSETCGHCGHTKEPIEFHIGKSSIGWVFSFRGYRDGSQSPTGKPILSAADWKNAMKQIAGDVIDEYDRPMSQEAFWALVDAKKQPLECSGKRSKPLVHAIEHPSDRDWLDAEGNTFADCSFS
jgi:uncharacterized Zn-finger protein